MLLEVVGREVWVVVSGAEVEAGGGGGGAGVVGGIDEVGRGEGVASGGLAALLLLDWKRECDVSREFVLRGRIKFVL